MTKIRDLHKKWMKDPRYAEEYNALEEEFALAAAVAKARSRAGLSQSELARRMKTTQSTVARLESGRGLPSTRTLDRIRESHRSSPQDQFRTLEIPSRQAFRREAVERAIRFHVAGLLEDGLPVPCDQPRR